LSSIVKDNLRRQFAARTIKQAVSGQRKDIMQALSVKANKEVGALGIKVVDVRIKRIELPDVVSDSVYERMRAERERMAKRLRAEGDGQAKRIRAQAEQKRTVILADAYSKAQKIRGDGDAKAAKIYARTYDKAPEFYSFYRSLQVYRNTWNNKHDLLVLEPNSKLFKYFKSPKKR
jgi:membrane protease subunit HflC